MSQIMRVALLPTKGRINLLEVEAVGVVLSRIFLMESFLGHLQIH
jgi:hypothetical protein